MKIEKNISEKLQDRFSGRLGVHPLEPIISMGTAAKMVGLSVSMLRRYENEGLMLYHRTDTGHRMLSQEDIERINFLHHLNKNRGINLEGIRRLMALIPCWELKPCAEDQKEKCSIFSDSSKPCWMLEDSECARAGMDCRTCVVYRFSAYCTEDLKAILHGCDSGIKPVDSR